MKVRIGFGLGTQSSGGGAAGLGDLGVALERHGFDSLWLSERVTGAALDPVVALTWVAARTERLKLGHSVLVLPGRNPAVLASELATLDLLSGGRFLPAFGLGATDPKEQQAFGVTSKERAPWFDEALPLLKRWWAGETVDHDGERFHYAGIRVQPRPAGRMEVWLGGAAPAALRRVGRLAEGWLPSFTSPEAAAAGKVLVDEAAAAAGRAIDAEHFGVLVPYLAESGPVPEPLARIVEARSPGTDPGRVVGLGPTALRGLLEDFLAVGFSKFVLVPIVDQEQDWDGALGRLGDAVLDLQT
jgi:probable F420-dependent oxidoreductase